MMKILNTEKFEDLGFQISEGLKKHLILAKSLRSNERLEKAIYTNNGVKI